MKKISWYAFLWKTKRKTDSVRVPAGPIADTGPKSGATVLAEELRILRSPPVDTGAGQAVATESEVRAVNFERGTAALCLSGGGIRSASFCLGVVQGLAKRGLLSKFDYLSTVSGGGYLGAMLATWAYRAGNGYIDVEAALSAATKGTILDSLRQYVRYLAPKQGFFSVDTWTLVSTYARNFVLNALVWFPAIAIALLIPPLIATVVDVARAGVAGEPEFQLVARVGTALALASILVGTLTLRKAIARDRELSVGGSALVAQLAPERPPVNQIQLLLFGGVFALSASGYWLAFTDRTQFWREIGRLLHANIPADAPESLLCGAAFAIVHSMIGYQYRKDDVFRWVGVAAGLVSGFVTGLLVWWLMTAMTHGGAWALQLEIYIMLAPVAFIAAIGVGEVLFVGAMSRFSTDLDREWWARTGAWAGIFTASWVGLCAFAFLGPWVVGRLGLSWIGVSGYWTVVAIAGMIARILLREEIPIARDGLGRPRAHLRETLLDIATALALTSILAGVAWAVARMLCRVPDLTAHLALPPMRKELPYSLIDVLALLTTFGVLLVLAGLCVNVNWFSLHAMYRDRLIRTFLGATRGEYPMPNGVRDTPQRTESNQFRLRNPERFIQFDINDNPILGWLAPDRGSAVAKPKGPFLIINAALNLVAGRNLAWQERKAASFTFTPLAIGSPTLGYRSSSDYVRDEAGITLGTAMAISGAAVSPNAGMHSSAIRTFLMTLLNARLGWWLAHPRDLSRVRRAGPAFAVGALVNELLGRTDDRRPWLFVSDGGHFENLGLYEAVRRGCRDIVVVDASCDPDRNYDDLGNAIRKIRIDLGVRIHRAGPLLIGPRELQADGRYCALFDVVYEDNRRGSLLYIKSALYPKADNLPIDVLQYAGRSDAFPHESTARQFFTESQFESYRALGEFEVDAIVEGVKMANRPDRTRPASVAEFVEIAAMRLSE